MLRECSMDPNETVQKLLYQDTFHEVKRKRDRRKETLSNREQSDSTWRAGVQGRGGRGGRGNYSSRYTSNDAGGSKDLTVGKEGGGPLGLEKGSRSNVVHDTENKLLLSSPNSTVITNGPVKAASAVLTDGPVSVTGTNSSCVGEDAYPSEECKTETAVSDINNAEIGHSVGTTRGPLASSLHQPSSSTPSPGVQGSFSDPVHLPSNEACHQSAVATIKCDSGSQGSSTESISNKVGSHVTVGPDLVPSSNEKVTPDTSNTNPADVSGKHLGKPQTNDVNLLHEVSESVTTSNAGSSDSRPSSNYSNRSMQLVGSQKVSVNKEWKPKQTKSNVIQTIGRVTSPDVSPAATDVIKSPVTSTACADITASIMQNKLEDLQLSDSQHVIFPNHIRIPEAERAGLSFGSFSANFAVKSNLKTDTISEKDTTTTEECETLDSNDSIQDISSGPQNAAATVHEDESPDHSESPRPIHETVSTETDLSGSVSTQEFDHAKPEAAPAPSAPQYPLVQSPPAYSSFGMMAPVLGSQLSGFENADTQSRETSRIPGFVPQQFDQSANYYTQMYRAAAEGDGRLSPFLVPGTAKYNGNPAILSNQSVQPPQESGNSPVQATSGPASVGTQGSGVMQTSIALTQQPVPLFRQPPAMHLSHYPPYIPYNQYFPSFYIPPPALHPFLSNAAFPQQHPAGSIYPPPVPGGTAPVKYSVSQFKSGANTGNSINTGLTSGYGLYSSTSTGYSPSPATSTVNSTSNDDLAGSQYKENNVYLTGQQSEGSTVWIPAPGRDLAGLQANSFYNISPQGQHMAFTPSQTGHGSFPAVYHATQTMANPAVHPLLQQSQAVAGAVEMVGPPGGVYQQPQRPQINWTNNY